jgi:hypothetical protein
LLLGVATGQTDVQHADVKLLTVAWKNPAVVAAATLATIVLLAISGVGAAGAQAATHFPLSPMSQENAVRKAQEYLRVESFSRQGLIKQLEYDHYSAEDAEFAVDSVAADWNQQAAGKAKEYLNMEGFSHEGLVTQLEYDGFTSSQAEYGVTAAGL